MRILSVDDNSDNLYLIESIARARGHEVVSAHNGVEAMEQLQLHVFDLIVSDVLMPEMDGFQLCRNVKGHARLKSVPFIFYTATYTATQDEELGLSLGASRFIVKPVEPDEFMAVVEQVVRDGAAGAIEAPPVDPNGDGERLTLYNQRLIHKLEHKIQQLEVARNSLSASVEELNREISQRRSAEEALAASEAQLRSMWDASMDGMLLRDCEGGILRVNPALGRIFAAPVESLPGRPFTCLYQCDSDSVLADYRGRVQSRSVDAHFEQALQRWTGESIWIEGSNAVIEAPAGPLVFSVIRDVTERHRSDEERTALQEQLRQAQKLESIGRLAGGVAHDFNNLLTVINGYGALVLGQLSEGDPLRECIEEICRAGERAAGLTHRLLAYSRKQALDPRVIDINEIVSGMRPMLTRLLGEDIALIVRLHSEPLLAYADARLLEQTLMNLVVNSRDAMPKGGELRVETGVAQWGPFEAQAHPGARPGRYIIVKVTDSGEGMSEETRARIFEPFFTTKEVGKGTGLGLSMVQGIVAQSGGYIDVQSAPGQGAAFTICLPEVEAAQDVADEAASPVSLRGKGTILVVEDQEEVRKYVSTALAAYGYRVIQARDGEEALTLCDREQGNVDLLLTDVVMPGQSGKALADRVCQRWPAIKVLFMSGYADDATMRHGVAAEHPNYVQKPFSPEALASKVRQTMEVPGRPARILVVDDEESARRFIRRLLEDAGYSVKEVADGKEAVSEVVAGGIDLVITDLVMPEQEGIETIQTLRRSMPRLGIIAVSGAFGGEFLKTAKLLGADLAMKKPLSAEHLLTAVADLLKARRV